MNEMKPEDVVRALELMVQRHLMPNVDIDGTVSVEDAERWFLKLLKEELAPYISDLLREKDAQISALQYQADFWDKHAKVLDEAICRGRKEIEEKDAEIERLTVNMNAYGLTAKNLAKDFADYQADVQMEIADARAEAITEFLEKAKESAVGFPQGEQFVSVGNLEQIASLIKYPPLPKNCEKIAKEMKEVSHDTCENCEHLHVIKGRIVYAKCQRTGTEFLVCSPDALDPKTHYCACAVWKGDKP